MASTFVNDLRLNEMATGDESGNWGNVTNTNLELIAEAFGFGTEGITTNADTHTSTIADGATDPARSMYLKYTGTLDSTCTITIAPNTLSKVWIIENATSGSQDIAISQGSGANVTIPNGAVKVIYSDGAGSGAAVVDAFADLNVGDSLKISGTTPTLTIGDAGAEDTKIVFDGNAQDFYIALDDSADDLVIGKGSTVGTTPAVSIDENMNVTFADGTSNVDIASHDASNGLKLGGTLVTALAAELNIMDGGTTASDITLADADRLVLNDDGTMKQIALTKLDARDFEIATSAPTGDQSAKKTGFVWYVV
jgi:hypothetical protein|tara:strand:- start:1843 stop:2772 length:930 start_codon:yes stop_codon:yes gene_type:complete